MTKLKSLDNYNPGIGLLRAVACWFVIVSHFWIYQPEIITWHYPLNMLRQLAVPVFMTLTFYFGSSRLMQSDPEWLRQRLVRIGVPIVVWSVVSYLMMKLTIYPTLTVSDLLYQILIGSDWEINGPMWFMNALLVITLILFCICCLPPKARAVVMWGLLVVSVILQYNHNVLQYVIEHYIYTPSVLLAMRCDLMLPYALAGIFCSRFDLFGRVSRMPWYSSAGCAVALFIAYFLLNRFEIDPHQISYVGATLWIGCAAMILLFLSLSKLITTDKSKRTVKVLTSYTLGIYLMHLPVGRILGEILMAGGDRLSITGFKMTFLIYPVCYLLCWCIARIPSRWARMLVN